MGIQKLQSLTRNKKKQDFFVYGIGQAFNLISPLLVVPHIVAICGEEGLGKQGMGFNLALFLILVVDYAFEIKSTKEVTMHRDDPAALQKIFNTTLMSKVLLFCITLCITLSLVYTIPFFSAERTLFLYSMAIVMAQVVNPAWFLLGMENFRVASFINIASKTGYLVMVFTFIRLDSDYILVNLLLGASAFIFNLSGLFFAKQRYGIHYVTPDLGEIRRILRADFSFCLSQLFLSARQLSPHVLISFFLGYNAAGQYKIIEQVITAFRTLIQVFLRFFFPSVCHKTAENPSAGFAFWKNYSAGNFALIAIALIGIFLFSDDLLRFFNASPDTIAKLGDIFKIALLIPLLMAVSLPLEQLMFVTGRNKAYVRITILVTVLNITMILLAIHNYGIQGIIVTLIAAEILFILLYSKNAFSFLKSTETKNIIQKP